MDFSLLFFSSNEADFADDKYRLFFETSKLADARGFKAIWAPERHFHAFGGLYPCPSLLCGALAMVTRRIRLRAGSVVLPMDHPIRVAEQWSVVDNLSGGRVDVAFATGWNPNDFVLAPESYEDRVALLFSRILTVKALWCGEGVSFPNGKGEMASVRLYPQPKQPDLPVWITCSGGEERFVQAGAFGANVLTALILQSLDDLATKIAAYRRARAEHDHDPAAGKVTLMMHTFIGDRLEEVRQAVQRPFMSYLRSAVELWGAFWKELQALPPAEQEEVIVLAFERYFRTAALFGTPETCARAVERLAAIGVDEIACLIDFGVDLDATMASLHRLSAFKDRFAGAAWAARGTP
ncbi:MULTISPECIES: MupA/Atu3671 family FMN-dependent luciferase-like monooxygenase [Sorangium]|uniref:Peptide synthetase n=1 Tax=Sorangium cellulosum TaxID=56 RepID=A0A4P2QIF0_SORCE|nr:MULTISPECIES: MupA/Atu3671 family FMN-dependent luciferase-like monooxygenase [Sorangium]AUX29426.1 peptide synthetase [Sorangium cellulosum]WCQ88821.1 Flavin-dependent trigonelline monooxygenase, oxygenase component [Sorangium sp. Soce836]